MKLTPKVAELERRCRRTEQDTIAYAERASAVWGPRIRAAMSDDEAARFPEPDAYFELLLEVAGVRLVRETREAMIAADRVNSRAVLELKDLCQRRDGAAGRLYDSISKVRQKLRPHLTPRQEKDHFFFSGPTPRQPFLLGRWASAMEDGLRDGGLEVEPGEVDAPGYADEVRDRWSDLDGALREVSLAEARQSDTGHQRQLAIEVCKETRRNCAQFVESALRVAGLDDEAGKLRGGRRPGRPRKKKTRASRAAETPESPEKALSDRRRSFSWPSQALRKARRSFSRLSQALRGSRQSFSRR